jgi:hypothetical protein
MIVFTFERSICAEVVTYRLDVVFGFLHTQQLRCFDESRNDQGIIQNRSAKINTTGASLYLPASYFSFRVLRLAQKIERMENGKNRVFDRSDGGEDDQNKFFPCTTSQLWR